MNRKDAEKELKGMNFFEPPFDYDREFMQMIAVALLDIRDELKKINKRML